MPARYLIHELSEELDQATSLARAKLIAREIATVRGRTIQITDRKPHRPDYVQTWAIRPVVESGLDALRESLRSMFGPQG